MRRYLVLAILWCGAWACTSPAVRPSLVTLSWDTPSEWAPRVGGITVWGEVLPDSELVWLVDGEVSRNLALELAQGRTPEALTDRRVPLLVVRHDALYLWPRVRLKASTLYSIVAVGSGVIATFQTTSEEFFLATRLGSGPLRAGAYATYCLPELPNESSPWGQPGPDHVDLPQGDRVSLREGIGSRQIAPDRCREFRVPGRFPYVLPPSFLAGVELDPELLNTEEGQAEEREASDRAPVREMAGTVEIQGEGAIEWSALRVQPESGSVKEAMVNGPAHLGPWLPRTKCTVDYVSVDARGRVEGRAVVEVGDAAPRLVLSEILADPRGPEPQGEWVELVNLGNGPALLSDYILNVSGDELRLPQVTLAPESFGLIVRDDFFVDAGADQVPASDAVRIPLSGLALKNEGVSLALARPDGTLASQLPALSGKVGVSLARRDPYLADDRRSFALHDEPGSSPGRPNAVQE